MKITTQNNFEDHTIKETLGLVVGSTVRTRHIGSDFAASIKFFVGGEIKDYSKLLIEAREEATQRLVEDAEKMGAHAIVCLRYNSSSFIDGIIEILAYGTAVKIQ